MKTNIDEFLETSMKVAFLLHCLEDSLFPIGCNLSQMTKLFRVRIPFGYEIKSKAFCFVVKAK